VVATIRGPLLALLGLLDGNFDGDALFFSRDITVDGDIGAVLALRNAVDDAQINLLDEVAASIGPLATSALAVAKVPMRSLSTFLSRQRQTEVGS
jgi:predicted lipid carrier protein YhbT